MTLRFTGLVQSGEHNASHWLALFNEAYARKIGMPVFPGSLNLALDKAFDWYAPEIVARTMTFNRAEYGGERDILLVRCVLENLHDEPAWLWTTTTATLDRDDPWVVEVIAARSLRQAFGLSDGSQVTVQLLDAQVVPPVSVTA